MSTKAKKGATPSSTPSSSQGTPGTPLSPTRHTRMQEKHDLQNLNDRLATYIDKVRQLESENYILTREVQSSQETVTQEISKIKSMYDTELQDARKFLDETHKEKAKLEIDTKRLWEDNEELKKLLSKKNKDLMLAQNDIRILETRSNEFQMKYNQVQSENKKINSELLDLRAERDKLKALVDDQRKQLEEESLARVEVENNNQSLKEELTFKDSIYHQQLTETRSRKQVEISEIDNRLCEQYETKLQETLNDIRADYEQQMLTNRMMMDRLYEQEIKNLKEAAFKNSESSAVTVDELKQTRTRIDGLCARLSELEALNNSLSRRNGDLEKMLEYERQNHREGIMFLESEVNRMRDEMTQQLKDYQDLMDIKVSLDTEILAYRKLLESEEVRLKISPVGTPEVGRSSSRQSSVRRTPIRGGGKRKRTLLEESSESSLSDYQVSSSAKGDIEISEICAEGRYVRLHNKSDKEISLSGWQVVRLTGELETSFKFHRSVKIEGGTTITVWGSDVGQAHEPPTNIVMKGQKWFVGDNMSTALVNSDGDEVARSERIRKQMSSSISRHREMGGDETDLLEEDFQGQSQNPEKCSIM